MKKLELRGNPIDIIFCIMEKYYPETVEKIKVIGFADIDIEKGFGVTQFNDDGSIEIYISPCKKDYENMDFETATELLAHEFAHAIVGIKEEHNEKWENTFARLNDLYYEYIKGEE